VEQGVSWRCFGFFRVLRVFRILRLLLILLVVCSVAGIGMRSQAGEAIQFTPGKSKVATDLETSLSKERASGTLRRPGLGGAESVESALGPASDRVRSEQNAKRKRPRTRTSRRRIGLFLITESCSKRTRRAPSWDFAVIRLRRSERSAKSGLRSPEMGRRAPRRPPGLTARAAWEACVHPAEARERHRRIDPAKNRRARLRHLNRNKSLLRLRIPWRTRRTGR